MFRSLWCSVALDLQRTTSTINRRPSPSSSLSSSSSATRFILWVSPISFSSFSTSNGDNVRSDSSFVVSYLINSCGLSENVAITVSKKIKLKNTSRPDSFSSLFENYGFTKPHISKLITKIPRLLLYNPHKTLKPKLDVFNSKGIHGTELADIISMNPFVLTLSLKSQLIPSLDILKSIVPAHTNIIKLLKRSTWILNINVVGMLMLNLEILRYEGVPDSTIIKYLIWEPRSFSGDADKFKKIVEKVKEMGFDPSATAFLIAIQVLTSMSEATWEAKVDVYKRWGWSDDQLQTAFQKNPRCMMQSEKKITAVMDFLVNEMGYGSSIIAEFPRVMNSSLVDRIIPRGTISRILVSKGLIDGKLPLYSLATLTNESFLEKYVKPYVQEAPELMKVFQGQWRHE